MNGLYILFYEASSDVCELTMYMVWYQEEQCLKNINRLATLFVCLRNQMVLGLLHWKYCSDFFISLCLFWISLSFTLFTWISSSFYSFCGRLLYLKLLKISRFKMLFFSHLKPGSTYVYSSFQLITRSCSFFTAFSPDNGLALLFSLCVVLSVPVIQLWIGKKYGGYEQNEIHPWPSVHHLWCSSGPHLAFLDFFPGSPPVTILYISPLQRKPSHSLFLINTLYCLDFSFCLILLFSLVILLLHSWKCKTNSTSTNLALTHFS